MTYTISEADYGLLHNENCQPGKYNLVLEENETLIEAPASLGQHGYTRSLELFPGVWLSIWNWRCDRDLILQKSIGDHPIQMLILNSGYLPRNNVYPIIGGKQSYLSGSGMSPDNLVKFTAGEHFNGINVYIEPEVFGTVFPDLDLNSAFAKRIIKKHDWKESFFPKITPSIWALVQQMIDPPYKGGTRKLYLQAKVLELLAIQLDPIIAESDCLHARYSLKSQRIDRIYQAREILEKNLEKPPSILELAQQVGVSDRTLLRDFKQTFNTTIIGYITIKRLEKAKQLLREGKLPLSEVADLVGYSNLSHFAAAFKRQFGITPSECKQGKLK